MAHGTLFGLTALACLGCGLVAGVFFAFSTFVMRALGRLPAADGIAAMQSINSAAINLWFMGLFVGTAVACAVLAGAAALRWQRPDAAWLVGGALIYLVGVFAVTVAFNVPRNEALAAVVPASGDGAKRWAEYLVSWTAWNHVRTVAALAATASLAAALLQD
jgi:uncharacterized membrane protein